MDTFHGFWHLCTSWFSTTMSRTAAAPHASTIPTRDGVPLLAKHAKRRSFIPIRTTPWGRFGKLPPEIRLAIWQLHFGSCLQEAEERWQELDKRNVSGNHLPREEPDRPGNENTTALIRTSQAMLREAGQVMIDTYYHTLHIWVHALDMYDRPIPSHRKIDSEFYVRLDGAEAAPVYISINKPGSRKLEWSGFCCDHLASVKHLRIWFEPVGQSFERRSPLVMRHLGMKQYTAAAPFAQIGTMFRRLQRITFTLDKPFGIYNPYPALDFEHHSRDHPILDDEDELAGVFSWIAEYLVCDLPTCQLATTEPKDQDAYAVYGEVLDHLRDVQEARDIDRRDRMSERCRKQPQIGRHLEAPDVGSEVPRVSRRIKSILKHQT